MREASSIFQPQRLAAVCGRAIEALLRLQKADGHWCGELQGDSILESEYVLMKFILGQERQPMADGSDGWVSLGKIARYLRSLQRPDGGWGQFPGSSVDLSATVKAYFALKLMGDGQQAPHMINARQLIRQRGGAEHCTSFTNFYLACLGQISWDAVPAIPPELVYLPRWFVFHMSKVSAWTRTMILPLSVVVTRRPQREIPTELGIGELFVDEKARDTMKNKAGAPPRWSSFFITIDRLLKLLHFFGDTPVRRLAIRHAERWILERAGQDGAKCTDGLGAIFPPMVYLQIALHALGYERDHPVIQRAERELDALFIHDERTNAIRIQPCFSPVWDTGIALYALTDCGMTAQDAAVNSASSWLREKECKHGGDWVENLHGGRLVLKPTYGRGRKGRVSPQGCWFFEYNNAWYPDCDDTAMVAMALKRAGGRENIEAAHRGVNWLLAMQNDDGGWAAFDKTTHRQYLEYIPFADHNAMQDPSCPDITGRVLECLSWHEFDNSHPAVRRAIEYIKSRQFVVRLEPSIGVDLGEIKLNGDAARPLDGLHHNGHAQQAEPLNGHATVGNGESLFGPMGGCWFGRWGVNYIYGTWQAVIGPIRCGEDPSQEWIQRAGRWSKSGSPGP